MRTIYKTVPGDTFDRIARKVYGDDTRAAELRRANPGITEPIQVGISLNTPAAKGAPKDRTSTGAANDPDELALAIDGQRFRFWSSIQIQKSIDKISTISFSAPFEPENKDLRNTFRPMTFKPLLVTVGGEPFFRGTQVNVQTQGGASAVAVEVSGYGVPGVLNDCTAPQNAFPVELKDLDLRQIADRVAGMYGVIVTFEGDPGAKFKKTKIKPDQKLLPFLVPLAQQRGFVVADNTEGELVFWKSTKTGRPVANLRQGEPPHIVVTPQYAPQSFYSDITAIKNPKIGFRGQWYTDKNPKLRNVLRALNFVAENAGKVDPLTAAKSKTGRMFGAVASYTLTVATWRDPKGNLWAPNTTIRVRYPDKMIYTDYEFLIRDVTFNATPAALSAELALVMPGAFSGEVPGALPWDD